MYTQHWGLKQSPFAGAPHGPMFYSSTGQSEALARIDYLIENGRRFGVLVGEDGLGKSAVLDHLANRESRKGSITVNMNLLGMDEAEFMVTLAEGLGDRRAMTASPAALWRSISDRLISNQYQQRPTVLLLDDAQEATYEVITAIGRLSQWNPAHATRVTILLGCTPDGVLQLGRRLLDLCDLKIELRPWRLEDTIGYTRVALEREGGSPTIFDTSALQTLQQLSRGYPRSIRRLADLALVAGAAQRLTQIDDATLYAVDTELRMPLPPAAA